MHVAASDEEPAEVHLGERHAEAVAGAREHAARLSQQRLGLVEAALVDEDLADVGVRGGGIDRVADPLVRVAGPLIQVERLGPAAVEVRLDAEVVGQVSLADEVADRLVQARASGAPSRRRQDGRASSPPTRSRCWPVPGRGVSLTSDPLPSPPRRVATPRGRALVVAGRGRRTPARPPWRRSARRRRPGRGARGPSLRCAGRSGTTPPAHGSCARRRNSSARCTGLSRDKRAAFS